MKTKLSLTFIFLFLFAAAVDAQVAPANGTVRFYDGAGRLKSVLKYKQERLVRKRLYYENGRLLFDCVYRGVIAIKIRTYYENGVLKSTWNRKSGEARFYYPDGRLRIVVNMPGEDAERNL